MLDVVFVLRGDGMICTIFSITSTKMENSEYVLYFLDRLLEISNYVYVCVPKDLDVQFHKQIKKKNVKIIWNMSNVGINSWKKIFFRDGMCQYEYVLIADDSMFGPFYSLHEIKKEILESHVDLWGLTEHEPIYSLCDHSFVQTYFFAISKSLFSSKQFQKFIKSIPNYKSVDEYMKYFEYTFTKYIENWGFLWRTKYKFDRSYNNQLFLSHILFDIKELICEKNFPFLPKLLFNLDKSILMNYNLGDELRICIDYIKKFTSYNEDYIYDAVMHELSPTELHDRLNLAYISHSQEQRQQQLLPSTAIFCYLFYQDCFNWAIDRLCNVPEECDIYIATDAEEKIKKIEDLWRQKGKGNRFKVLKHKYNGRDVSALLLTFRNYILKYDIFCFIHDKKSIQMGYSTIGKALNEHIWECLLGNEQTIRNTVSLLDIDRRLGILAPPFVMAGMYFYVDSNPWTVCYEGTVKLAKKLGLKVKIKKKDDLIFLGNCFWGKTQALKKILQYNWREIDFPSEPLAVDGTINHCIERILSYVAYDAGFYTGNIINVEIAEREFITQKYLIHSIMEKFKNDSLVDMTTLEKYISTIGER